MDETATETPMDDTTSQITDHTNDQDGDAAKKLAAEELAVEKLAAVSEEQAALDNLELISQLVQQLAANQNQYELHIQLIKALRDATMFDELRTAREQMHKIFPMSEALWLEWIEDEKRMAFSEEEKVHIITIYKKALDDYLSIPIWIAYLNYVAKNDITEDEDDAMDQDDEEDDHDEGDVGYTIEEKREILLRAVSATQWHVPQSHQVWNLYKNFEEKLLKKSPSPEQHQRVKDMYLKRLAIPHETLDATFTAYSSFVSAHDPANYETILVATNKVVATTRQRYDNEREPFERSLIQSSNALPDFFAYLDWERTHRGSDSFAVRTLFERAVAVHCLVPSLWEEYLYYLVEKFSVPNILIDTAERAVRNCPWAGDLWAEYARIWEMQRGPHDEVVAATLQRALEIGMVQASVDELVKVTLAQCDHARRGIEWVKEGGVTDEEAEYIRAVFKGALDTVAKVFPEGDPFYRLDKYYAELEATKLGNVKEARKIWENLIKRHGTEAEAWLRYIEFERRHGDLAACETLLKRAVQRKLDWPERLLEAWVTFEHEEGSLESTHYALIRVRRKARDVELQRQTEAALTAEQVTVEEEKQKRKTEKDVAYKQKKRANYYEKRATKNEEKRKRDGGSAEPEESPGSKKSKQEEDTREEGTREAEAGHQEQPAAEGEASKANSMGPPVFMPRRQQLKQKSRPGQAEHDTEGEAARNGGQGDKPITRRLAGQRPHAKLSKGPRGGRGGGVLGRGGKGPVDEAGGSEGAVGDGGGEGGQVEAPQKKSNADFRAMFLGSK